MFSNIPSYRTPNCCLSTSCHIWGYFAILKRKKNGSTFLQMLLVSDFPYLICIHSIKEKKFAKSAFQSQFETLKTFAEKVRKYWRQYFATKVRKSTKFQEFCVTEVFLLRIYPINFSPEKCDENASLWPNLKLLKSEMLQSFRHIECY